MPQKLIFSILIVSGVSVVLAATDLYLPSLPNMARYFGVEEQMVQFTIAAYLTGTSIVPFFYGYLVDHKGRRFSTLLGFSIFVFGSFLCLISSSLWVLTLGRFLQGAGGASINVSGFAAIKDMYTKEEGARVIAYNGMAISLSPVLAPVLGGYIEVAFGWRYNFALIAVLSVLILGLMYRFYQETMDLKNHTPEPGIFRRYLSIFKSGPFMAISLVYPFLFGAIFAWITVSPFYMIEVIGLSPDTFGIYGMFCVLGYPLGAFCNSRMIPWIGLEKTLFVGLGACLLSCVLLIFTYLFYPLSPKLLCFDIALFVLGIGIVFATSTTLSMNVFSTGSGAMSAVLHMFRMGAAAVGSYAGGLMDDHTLKPLIIYMTTSALVSTILYMIARRNNFSQQA